MERLSADFPPGMKYRIAFNTTQVVDASIREVLITLAEAIALVVLVMFLFLQSWRTTLIPTITIPVSLIGAFAFVKLMDFSINTLTLFGIILATGIVVDDAIVVIENIERHIQEFKKPALKAASDGMKEVLGAVIATALVLVAVFVPVAFFPGTTGRLYAQFSITIAFSVALSAFNALTLTPALSALLLDRSHHGKGVFFRGVERVITAGTHLYIRVLGRLMRVRWAVVLVFLVGLGATWAMYRIVPQALVPEEDPGYFITVVQAPGGASLQYTGGIARQAEQILMKDPDVDGRVFGHGVQLQRRGPQPGADLHEPQAVRRARRGRAGAQGRAEPHPRPAVRHQRRDGAAVRSRPDSRARRVRRLRVPGARPDRRRDRGAGRRRRRGWSVRATGRAGCRGSSARSPSTTRSCRSTSTASGRWRSASPSTRSRARCRSTSARSTSTTSTSTTAPTGSTSRPTRRSAPSPRRSGSSTCARTRAT